MGKYSGAWYHQLQPRVSRGQDSSGNEEKGRGIYWTHFLFLKKKEPELKQM